MIGSYSGDYLHMSNEQLGDYLKQVKRKGYTMSLYDQIVSDVNQVLEWRRQGDPRGWPMGQMPQTK